MQDVTRARDFSSSPTEQFEESPAAVDRCAFRIRIAVGGASALPTRWTPPSNETSESGLAVSLVLG
jgi:hypothetical protein